MMLFSLLRRAPAMLWWALAALLAIIAVGRWHDNRVAAAFTNGARQQAIVDRARFDAAARAATVAQQALVTRLARRQATISKETQNALDADTADLARRYDDLRLRWAAHDAGRSRSGAHDTTGVSGPAPGAVAAPCAAAGWVSFDTAAAAAQAADEAIARDDAWIAWATAQREAWPSP